MLRYPHYQYQSSCFFPELIVIWKSDFPLYPLKRGVSIKKKVKPTFFPFSVKVPGVQSIWLFCLLTQEMSSFSVDNGVLFLPSLMLKLMSYLFKHDQPYQLSPKRLKTFASEWFNCSYLCIPLLLILSRQCRCIGVQGMKSSVLITGVTKYCRLFSVLIKASVSSS